MPAAIRRGPRWTDFVRTVEEAVQAVRTPLTDLERAHGWTEDLWRVVRDHFEQQLEELRRLGPGFAPTYAGWVKSEVLDPGARDARWTAILRADDLALAFGAAEESIASAERLELLTHTESRLALASELGADAIVDVSKEDIVERVRDITDGEMADVVLDMSAGSTEPVLQALDTVRMGGRVVLAGLKNGKPVSGLVTDKIVVKELQVLGGFSSTADSLDIALEILRAHHRRLGPICSHSFGLDEADLAVRTLGREVDDGKEVVHVSLVIASQ